MVKKTVVKKAKKTTIPKTPRLAFSPSRKLDSALNEMSDAVGMPKSKIISELMEEALPTILDIVKAVHKAKRGNLSGTMDVMRGMLIDAGLQMSEAENDLVVFEKKHSKAGVKNGAS